MQCMIVSIIGFGINFVCNKYEEAENYVRVKNVVD